MIPVLNFSARDSKWHLASGRSCLVEGFLLTCTELTDCWHQQMVTIILIRGGLWFKCICVFLVECIVRFTDDSKTAEKGCVVCNSIDVVLASLQQNCKSSTLGSWLRGCISTQREWFNDFCYVHSHRSHFWTIMCQKDY